MPCLGLILGWEISCTGNMTFKDEKVVAMLHGLCTQLIQKFVLAAHQTRTYKCGFGEMNLVKSKFLAPRNEDCHFYDDNNPNYGVFKKSGHFTRKCNKSLPHYRKLVKT